MRLFCGRFKTGPPSLVKGKEIMLIPSKNQVDYGGGYVECWTTKKYKEKLDSLLNIYVRSRTTDTSLLKHTGGYTTVRAALGYKLNDKLKLTLRGENLLDEEYEIVYPSGTPGISGYAGFTYTFN